MSYEGFEIDMLSLGDADCILVTQWHGHEVQRVLIDGGNPEDTDKIQRFLQARSVQHLDHIVCTHPDNDHSGGLVNLLRYSSLSVGNVWIHRPERHVDRCLVESVLHEVDASGMKAIILESFNTVCDIIDVCEHRRIEVTEPFEGQQIGMLTVVGPTKDYYRTLVAMYRDSDAIRGCERILSQPEYSRRRSIFLEEKEESLDSNPQTTPENNSSVILALSYNSKTYLFTGDAGVQALEQATQNYNLGDCHWMQIPHHGSRRNITQTLINYFRPTKAYVSASGNSKHPRQIVVDAFKNIGTRVYSTHHPDKRNLWHHRGTVPMRTGARRATEL